ncbi:MAG: mechanosensitive ion channel family protein, partial [Halieaceae bacterium]
LRVTLWVLTSLMVLQSLGVSVSGLLAFGGIGGIAVGFAAKDLLANFFGGLGIYLDRPFTVGDWIRSPDKEVEGTVEDIGWRVTRIRTFDQRPLYVPNSVFSQIAIQNPTRMFNRRIYETIGLRYEDADKVAKIVDEVRSMLEQHDAIDLNRTLIVNFVSFGASSLDFFVYTFTRTTAWVEYHAIKQDILLKILAIIHANDADVAFPTRTLHVEAAQPEPSL